MPGIARNRVETINRRSIVIAVRVSELDFGRIAWAAGNENLSDWMRRVLVQAAQEKEASHG